MSPPRVFLLLSLTLTLVTLSEAQTKSEPSAEVDWL